MQTVLVVDDLATDRARVGGLLARDLDLRVNYAAHGRQALDKLEEDPPDLVVTDLQMPELDGLQLVEAIRAQYNQVPVILMTSRGSEDIAVEALHKGAASYVPKRLLGTYLLETVQRLLAVAAQQRGRQRLLGCMSLSECHFTLENDANLIPVLVGYMQETSAHLGLSDQTERFRVSVALEEALMNAMFHGNLELTSDMRCQDAEAYLALAEQRRADPLFGHRAVHVHATMSSDRLEFVIRDEGPGFDPASLPDPTDPENLERACGRGVLLMRTFMDDVRFNNTGNQVTLVKGKLAS